MCSNTFYWKHIKVIWTTQGIISQLFWGPSTGLTVRRTIPRKPGMSAFYSDTVNFCWRCFYDYICSISERLTVRYFLAWIGFLTFDRWFCYRHFFKAADTDPTYSTVGRPSLCPLFFDRQRGWRSIASDSKFCEKSPNAFGHRQPPWRSKRVGIW